MNVMIPEECRFASIILRVIERQATVYWRWMFVITMSLALVCCAMIWQTIDSQRTLSLVLSNQANIIHNQQHLVVIESELKRIAGEHNNFDKKIQQIEKQNGERK